MIIWIVLTFVFQLLMTTLASSLRHLNFSQLQNIFEPEEYSALVNQLKNRDEVEVLAWAFATFAAIACVSGVSFVTQGDLFFLAALSAALTLFLHIIPLIAVAPWAESFLIELMPLYQAVESFPFGVSFISFIKRVGYNLAGEAENETLSMEMSHLIREGEAEGTVGSSEKVMIEQVIELKNTSVRDVMTPRANLVFLNEESSVREAMSLASEHGLSRLPLYDSEKDQIIGVFFVRDVLKEIAAGSQVDDLSVQDMMRQVPVVPETRSIGSLLHTMSKSRNQMLVVLDEYGGLTGVVTLEDLLEEIVGEIRDEYAPEEDILRKVNPGVWEVLGGAHIEDVNKVIGIEIPEDPLYETIAGFLLSQVERIPQTKEIFTFSNFRLIVSQASSRRIEKLRLEII